LDIVFAVFAVFTVVLGALNKCLALLVGFVDAACDNCLLTHAHDIRAHEVKVETGGKTDRDDRQEPGHQLHDHLLLRIDWGIRITASGYLTLLNIAAHPDQNDQQQIGQRFDKRVSKGISDGA